MDNVTCSGFENNIDQCQFAGWGIHDCRHGEDSGIECSSGIHYQMTPEYTRCIDNLKKKVRRHNGQKTNILELTNTSLENVSLTQY